MRGRALRARDGDVVVEERQDDAGVASLQRGEQLLVLLDDQVEVAELAVAQEVGADPRRDRAPELERVRPARALEDRLVKAKEASYAY